MKGESCKDLLRFFIDAQDIKPEDSKKKMAEVKQAMLEAMFKKQLLRVVRGASPGKIKRISWSLENGAASRSQKSERIEPNKTRKPLPAYTNEFHVEQTFYRSNVSERLFADTVNVFKPAAAAMPSIRKLNAGKFTFETTPDFTVLRFQPGKSLDPELDSNEDKGFLFRLEKTNKIVEGEKCADLLHMFNQPPSPSSNGYNKGQAMIERAEACKKLRNGRGRTFRIRVGGVGWGKIGRRTFSLEEIRHPRTRARAAADEPVQQPKRARTQNYQAYTPPVTRSQSKLGR